MGGFSLTVVEFVAFLLLCFVALFLGFQCGKAEGDIFGGIYMAAMVILSIWVALRADFEAGRFAIDAYLSKKKREAGK